MKNLKLIFKIVFLLVGVWIIRTYYVNSFRETDKSTENYDVSFSNDNKELDEQVKGVLSNDVIETSITSGEDDYNTGVTLDGESFSAGNAFYEKNDNGVEITIPGNIYTVILKINDLKPGEYDLSDNGNELKVYDGNNFNVFRNGVASVTEVSEGTVSGYFKAGNVTGKFTKALSVEKLKNTGYEITLSNSVMIKSDGTIEKKILISRFYYDDRNVSIEMKGADGNDSFSAEVESIDAEPASVILKVDDDDIDYILVDQADKQVTIQYKNGDSFILL